MEAKGNGWLRYGTLTYFSGQQVYWIFKIVFIREGFLIMGKYIGGAIIIFLILVILEWFQIVDIPFLELPDFTAGKKEMIHKTKKALD
jgi:hypothetical protein